MAKIIVTSRYIRNTPKRNAANLVKYMGTREGVERVPSAEKPAPATVRQQRLIKDLLKADADARNYLEYRDYENDPTKQRATEFIDAFIERNADRVDEIDKLLKYMAERPGVEKLVRTACSVRRMTGSISILLRKRSEIIRELSGRTWSV